MKGQQDGKDNVFRKYEMLRNNPSQSRPRFLIRVQITPQFFNVMEIGNVVKLKSGSIVVLTKFSTTKDYSDNSIHDYVSFDFYREERCTGGMRVIGYNSTRECSCWYVSMARCHHASEPDYECEDCNGTGKEPYYVDGLNDATFLAVNVIEYQKMQIKDKIEKLQATLKLLEE